MIKNTNIISDYTSKLESKLCLFLSVIVTRYYYFKINSNIVNSKFII